MTHTIIGSLFHVWNLLAFDQGVDDPLKTLFGVNHLNDNLSLDTLMMISDVLLESFIATTDICDNVTSF